jgi:hypothetical protein
MNGRDAPFPSFGLRASFVICSRSVITNVFSAKGAVQA